MHGLLRAKVAFFFSGVTPDPCQGHHSEQSASQLKSVWKIKYPGTTEFPQIPAPVISIDNCCKYLILYLLNDNNTLQVPNTYSEPSYFLSDFHILTWVSHSKPYEGTLSHISENRTEKWRSHCEEVAQLMLESKLPLTRIPRPSAATPWPNSSNKYKTRNFKSKVKKASQPELGFTTTKSDYKINLFATG